jgi:two-component system CheB/CheR fusion protein
VPHPISVLIVEDQPEACEVLANVIEAEGHFAITCRSGVEGLQKLQLARPGIDLIITDHFMPGSYDGLGLVRIARAKGFHKHIIVTSGRFTPEIKASYDPFSVLGFLTKPFDMRVLRSFLYGVALSPVRHVTGSSTRTAAFPVRPITASR